MPTTRSTDRLNLEDSPLMWGDSVGDNILRGDTSADTIIAEGEQDTTRTERTAIAGEEIELYYSDTDHILRGDTTDDKILVSSGAGTEWTERTAI